MRKTRHFKKLGANAACTLCLAEATLNPGDTGNGDAFFGSVIGVTEIAESTTVDAVQVPTSIPESAAIPKKHFISVVKKAHKRHPKQWLEDTMKDWPAGTSLVLRSQFGDNNLIAIGYKYKMKGVISFIATYGADFTSNGDPYLSKFVSEEHKNYKTREVLRPRICSAYFSAAPFIDIHNQSRQGFLRLEDHWRTINGYFRFITTIIGITATDCHFVSNYSFPSDSIYANLEATRLVSISKFSRFW